ncbi:MAG: hypothetical protein ABMA13_23555 [Chthoniobacteraceae bacterium]
MNAHDTALAIARAIAASPGLPGVQIYAHDTLVLPGGFEQNPVEEITLPGVFIRVRFDGLCGSGTIGRGRAEITVESQSDDESSATHSAREKAVRDVMADQAALELGFLSTGTVKLLGRPALTDNEPDTEARAFKTPLTYKLGVQTL